MMINKNKNIGFSRVAGFTILETVITMALTGLVVLLAFAGLTYFQRLFINIQNNDDVQTKIKQLQTALNNDFAKSTKVIFGDGLSCISEGNTVNYQLDEKEIIVRNTREITDTFHIVHDEPVILISEKANELISSLTIPCKNGELLLPVSAVKEYPLGLIMEEDN